MDNDLGIVINATPEQVWSVLADPTRLPQWLTREGPFPHIIKVEGKPGVGEPWFAEAMDGQTAVFTVATWDEPQQLAYELTTPDDKSPIRVEQRHQFDLDIDEGGTLVTWLITWQLIEADWLAGWLQQNHLDKDIGTMQTYSLLRLKEIIETEVSNEPDNEIEQPAETESDGD